jgi:cytochrome oxidase Cu insertion factor (SCO1/SenC/PrrC family)
MNKNLSSLSLLIALLVLFAFSPSALPDEPVTGVEVGQLAPDFDLPQVDGERVQLYDVVAENDVTILYFFLAAS